MLENMIKNFSLDQKFKPVDFFKNFLDRYLFPKRHKMF